MFIHCLKNKVTSYYMTAYAVIYCKLLYHRNNNVIRYFKFLLDAQYLQLVLVLLSKLLINNLH